MTQKGHSWESESRRWGIRKARRDGLVPLAIADKLELSLSTVTRYLGELEDAGEIDHVPSFLTGAPR